MCVFLFHTVKWFLFQIDLKFLTTLKLILVDVLETSFSLKQNIRKEIYKKFCKWFCSMLFPLGIELLGLRQYKLT